jgi:hypothetical protein
VFWVLLGVVALLAVVYSELKRTRDDSRRQLAAAAAFKGGEVRRVEPDRRVPYVDPVRQLRGEPKGTHPLASVAPRASYGSYSRTVDPDAESTGTRTIEVKPVRRRTTGHPANRDMLVFIIRGLVRALDNSVHRAEGFCPGCGLRPSIEHGQYCAYQLAKRLLGEPS